MKNNPYQNLAWSIRSAGQPATESVKKALRAAKQLTTDPADDTIQLLLDAIVDVDDEVDYFIMSHLEEVIEL